MILEGVGVMKSLTPTQYLN